MPPTNRRRYVKDLLLLFSVPAGVALLAFGIVYVPRLLARPGYDFIYSACASYRCSTEYTVDASGYIQQDTSPDGDIYRDGRSADLYYYSVKQNTAKRVTLEDARQHKLDTSLKAPDGYSLMRESTSSGFLFWSDYSDGWYLKNGAKKKKVELTGNESYYAGDIKFLGWVSK